jgi:Mg2+/Co2+ transporter CorB
MNTRTKEIREVIVENNTMRMLQIMVLMKRYNVKAIDIEAQTGISARSVSNAIHSRVSTTPDTMATILGVLEEAGADISEFLK